MDTQKPVIKYILFENILFEEFFVGNISHTKTILKQYTEQPIRQILFIQNKVHSNNKKYV
jgi:hypothetical protein